MDIEQLKLIIDAVQSMGGEAKEFAIWWMAIFAIREVLASFSMPIAIVAAIFFVSKAVKAIASSQNVLRLVASSVGMSPPEFGCWEKKHTNELLLTIKILKNEAEQCKHPQKAKNA